MIFKENDASGNKNYYNKWNNKNQQFLNSEAYGI
jgi:hypothetical protein